MENKFGPDNAKLKMQVTLFNANGQVKAIINIWELPLPNKKSVHPFRTSFEAWESKPGLFRNPLAEYSNLGELVEELDYLVDQEIKRL